MCLVEECICDKIPSTPHNNDSILVLCAWKQMKRSHKLINTFEPKTMKKPTKKKHANAKRSMNACESLELEMEMDMVETKEKNVTLQNLIHLHLPCQVHVPKVMQV
jgi:hypothetical protein